MKLSMSASYGTISANTNSSPGRKSHEALKSFNDSFKFSASTESTYEIASASFPKNNID